MNSMFETIFAIAMTLSMVVFIMMFFVIPLIWVIFVIFGVLKLLSCMIALNFIGVLKSLLLLGILAGIGWAGSKLLENI